MAKGTITRKEIIEDEAMVWPIEYAKNAKIAIDANNDIKQSALEMFDIYNKLDKARNQQDYLTAKQQEALALKKATNAIKLQEAAEISAEKVKREHLKTAKALEQQTKRNSIAWKTQQQAEDALIRTKQKNLLATESTNRQLIKERAALRNTNKEIRQNMTFLGRLTNLRDKARQRVQELNAKILLGNKLHEDEQQELEQSKRAYEKYNNALVGIRKATGQFNDNVGNYPKQIQAIGQGIKSLLPAFGVIGGLKAALDFSLEARQFAIDAKGIEFTFERIGERGEEAFNKIKTATRGALSDLDIKKAIVEFDNFNLSLEDMDGLLEFVAVRAAQTGKSFDYLRDSLVEGLSKKSKLRIDNLGISATELNAELEKTPDFVKAVANIAKKEVAEAGTILDDATNSQQEWNAAYENFQLNVGKGAIAQASDAMYQFGTNILRAVTPTQTFVSEIEKEQLSLNFLAAELTSTTTSEERRNKIKDELIAKYPNYLSFLKEETVDNEKLKNTINQINSLYNQRINIAAKQDEVIEAEEEFNKALKKQQKELTKYREKVVAIALEKEKSHGVEFNIDFSQDPETYGGQLDKLLNKHGEFLRNFHQLRQQYSGLNNDYIRATDNLEFYRKKLEEAKKSKEQNSQIIQENREELLKETVTLESINDVLEKFQKNQITINEAYTEFTGKTTATNEEMKAFEDTMLNLSQNTLDNFITQMAIADLSIEDERESLKNNNLTYENAIIIKNDYIQLFDKQITNTDEFKKSMDDLTSAEIKERLELIKSIKATNDKIDVNTLWAKSTNALIGTINNLTEAEKNYNLNTREGVSNKLQQLEEELKTVEFNSAREKDLLKEISALRLKLNPPKSTKSTKSNDNTRDLKRRNNAAIKYDREEKEREHKRIARQKQLADDRFNLEVFKIKQNVENEMKILDNEENSFNDRLNAANHFFTESVKLLDKEKEKALNNAKGRKDELNRIQLAYNDDYLKLEEERAVKVEDILSDQLVKANQRIEDKKVLEEQILNDEIINLQEQLNKREITVEQYEEQLVKIRQKSAIDVIQAQIDQIQTELTWANISFEQRRTLLEQLSALELALSQAKTDNTIYQIEKENEAREEQEEKEKQALQRLQDYKNNLFAESARVISDSFGLESARIEALFHAFGTKAESTGDAIIDKYNQVAQTLQQISAVSSVVGDVFSAISENNLDRIDEEIEANERYYNRQLELAGNDQEQKELIVAEAEKKRKALEAKKKKEKIKAAKAEKYAAAFSIGLNTAAAILGIWAQVPKFDFGVSATLLTALVGSLGALQITSVLAKPIPKYAKGTENHPGGLAEVAEVRPEVVHEPNKKPYLVRSRAILNLPKKTKVYSSEEAFRKAQRASIMASLEAQKNRLNDYETALVFDNHYKEYIDEMRLTRKAIEKNKPIPYKQPKPTDLNHELFRYKNTNWT